MFDAFLTHSCYCQRLSENTFKVLDDTENSASLRGAVQIATAIAENRETLGLSSSEAEGLVNFVLPALLQKLVGEFFFDFSQGNLENLVGNLEGIFRDFF